ncbi:MAG: tRNA lysidine(34) synthetase TilS [Spirochaetaceae bacterium]|jgi:tRNA(Ile)-lysidine synthase|nr:tRNA lysidine(34) synthetase TilS [Spirochaetaceae bacterium]
MQKRPKRKAEIPGLEERVASALADFPRGSRFIAAVSGGADSTALLAAAALPVRERGQRLYCFHVDHGLRPGAERAGDAEAVKNLAVSLGLPWKICRVKTGRIIRAAREWGSGIEAAARRFRRRAWNREYGKVGAVRVLVAHNRDDVLENILMGFLRGAGPRGLAGIPAARNKILRPLIGAGRAEIRKWLTARGISWREDSTNSDPAFFRNRVRTVLVPLLDARFPAWRSGVQALAETQRNTADFLAAEAARRLPWEYGVANTGIANNGVAHSSRGFSLDLALFLAAPAPLREEALFHGGNMIGRKQSGPASRRHPGTIRRQTIRHFAQGTVAALDMGPFRGEIRENRINLVPPLAPRGERGFCRLIKAPGLYTLNRTAIMVRETEISPLLAAPIMAAPIMAMGQVELPIAVRPPFPGEVSLPRLLRNGAAVKPDGGLTGIWDRNGLALLFGVKNGEVNLFFHRAGTGHYSVRVKTAENGMKKTTHGKKRP